MSAHPQNRIDTETNTMVIYVSCTNTECEITKSQEWVIFSRFNFTLYFQLFETIVLSALFHRRRRLTSNVLVCLTLLAVRPCPSVGAQADGSAGRQESTLTAGAARRRVTRGLLTPDTAETDHTTSIGRDL